MSKTPVIGSTVLYTLSAADAAAINKRRRDFDAHRKTGAYTDTGYVAHFGNAAIAGEVYPATVLRVWGGDLVNLKAHLDGTDDFWATSVAKGDGPRCWAWPEAETAPRPAAGEPISDQSRADELAGRFAYHPPADQATVRAHETVRELCGHFAAILDRICPASREKSLALTAVQEAMMWANAAIAIHGGPCPEWAASLAAKTEDDL